MTPPIRAATTPANTTGERTILSVSDLNRQARTLLEGNFGQVWVEGEISNFKAYSSGHWYFTLKDDNAQVSCAMFSGRNRLLRFSPRDGMQVILRGKASLYEVRGNYQLIAESLVESGEGLLKRRYDELKARLQQAGLFAPEHKKSLPGLPRHIGIITSPTGAAIRDILSVLKRRFPAIPVTVIPTLVQGSDAAQQIVAAIKLANTRTDLDVLIVGRGGGSLEDLWPFNEEPVARAIFASELPIVSAVGHEVDFTIADYVADHRAATPSAAAELVSPDREEWLQNLSGIRQLLDDQAHRLIQQLQQTLDLTGKRLRHPGKQLQDQARRMRELENRLTNSATTQFTLNRTRLAQLKAELAAHHPQQNINFLRLTNQQLMQRLSVTVKRLLENSAQKLGYRAQALNAFSPLQTLNRGYAIVTNEQQQILRSAADVTVGDGLTTRLAEGRILSTVNRIDLSDNGEASE